MSRAASRGRSPTSHGRRCVPGTRSTTGSCARCSVTRASITREPEKTRARTWRALVATGEEGPGSACESRRDESLPAALERCAQRARLRVSRRLERDGGHQSVDAEAQTRRVDPRREQRTLLDRLDRLAVESEDHAGDPDAANAGRVRTREAAVRGQQAGADGADALAEHKLVRG